MKKILSFFVIMSLVLTMIMTGCGKSDSKSTNANEGSSEAKKELVQTKPVKIMMVEVNKDGFEATDNEKVKKYMEDQSGVKFEMILVKDADELGKKVNLALASTEDVDVIQVTYDQAKMANLVERKALQKLNTIIDKYGPNLKKQFPADTSWKAVSDKDGSIWAVPRLQGDMGNTLYIRKDWREKMGIKNQPTTLDEFEAYLKAVKANDPAGNKAFPMISIKGYSEFDWGLSYVFTEECGDPTANYIDSNKKVTPKVLHPQYKEYLRKLAQWHKEGLIHPEIYNLKKDQSNDLIIANKVGAGAGWYSDPIRPWDTLKKTVPEAEYEFFGLKSLKGKPYQVSRNPAGTPGMAVVSYSKNAEFAIKLMDWTVTNKNTYLTTRQGIPNEHWKWENEEKGTFLDTKQKGKNIYKGAFSLTMNEKIASVQAGDPGFVENKYSEVKVMMNKIGYIYKPDWFVDYKWKGTAVENTMNDAATLIEEAIVKIIIGQRPIDDWDKVLEQYRKMYADKYIELATKAYNEYKK